MTYQQFLDIAATWPEVNTADLVAGRYRGRVTHMIYHHSNWCPTVNGESSLACRCQPTITHHLQPALWCAEE